MFTTHFYDDKIDDVAVSYLVWEIIIQVGLSEDEKRDTEKSLTGAFFLFGASRSLIGKVKLLVNFELI